MEFDARFACLSGVLFIARKKHMFGCNVCGASERSRRNMSRLSRRGQAAAHRGAAAARALRLPHMRLHFRPRHVATVM